MWSPPWSPDVPLVEVVRRGCHLVFRCRYCRRTHYHGAVGPRFGQGDGHRVAHCNPPSPYTRHGYILREVAAPAEARTKGRRRGTER